MKKSKFLLLGSLSSLAAIPFVAAKCGDTKEDEKKPTETTPGNPAETPGGSQNNPGGNQNPGSDTAPANVVKIDLSKLEEKIKEELNKLAKNGVSPESVLDVIKKVKGLETLTLSDLSTVEFKDKKLTIEAHKDSKLISGKYEFTVQSESSIDPLMSHKNKIKEFVFKNLKELNVENPSLATDFNGLFKDLEIDSAKTKDDFLRIKEDLKYLFGQWYSSFEESPFHFNYSDVEPDKDDKESKSISGGNPYAYVSLDVIEDIKKQIEANKDNENHIYATLNSDIQTVKEALEKQIEEQNNSIEKLFEDILNKLE
ncbi:Variable surface lipoprotein C like protein (VpmaC) [Mycoplasmopsis agalactiae 14628]|uniref:Variable surface lipoprotein C like protein (VpmaC) n=1 Tax=Mycoplasmopsis agalactiae 14628 TaxID=1110504 RepID=I5D502_MYCAA|nr:variable surface lipoprotein [Mycoplasmopsis agalactiae]EIN14761.1 Variable surface lipoprotein C like protein (VpmaC) [Mycoplasmopsis agalactiae 14628]